MRADAQLFDLADSCSERFINGSYFPHASLSSADSVGLIGVASQQQLAVFLD